MGMGKSSPFGGRLYELSLLSSLFLVLFELAAGSSYYLMEISLLFLLSVFLVCLISTYGLSPVRILRALWDRIRGCWVCFLFLFLYLGWDVFSVSYAVTKQGFFEKYKVVLLMLFLSVAILLYATGKERIDRVLWVVLGAGVFSALFSILNYAALRLYPIYYGKRLSIRLDYNMFASVLMMGLIAGFFLILQQKLDSRTEAIALFALFEAIAPVIVLSSSRRNYLLLFPVSILFFADYFYLSFRRRKYGDRPAKRLTIITSLVTLLSVVLTVSLLNVYLTYAYNQLKNSDKGGFLMEGEASAQSRYETIEKEASNSKRSLIWGIAIQEAKSYSGTEKLKGKGFGYDRYLYSHVENKELDEAYTEESKAKLSAHCFVLADLLNGGWVQVGLSVLLWGGIGVLLLILFQAYPMFSQLYWLSFFFIFMNNLISNRFGFLYDKFFWIFFVLLSAEIRLIRRDDRRVFYGK